MIEKEKQQTIYDISAKAGVSIATVSRVLNDSAKVSAKTKERVLRVIDECGYEPNAFARGLGTGSMKTIGILCADVSDIYLANAVSFLERDLRQNGFDTVLNCTGSNYETKVRCMKTMESRRVDAVILVGSQYIEQSPRRNQYILDAAQNIPVMLVNGYLKSDNIYCSLSDDYSAFYGTTLELLDQGCERILFLYREMSYSREMKYKGYRDALRDRSVEEDPNLCVQSRGKMEEVKEDLLYYTQNGGSFDGVLACDDELAIGVMKYANAVGRRIPQDLAIIGCNNSVLSICCQPELSSVDNQCESLCVNTVAMLMRVLDGRSAARKTVFSTEYIGRATTREKKNGGKI